MHPIEAGEKVWSCDHDGDRGKVLREVVQVFVRKTDTLVDLTVEDEEKEQYVITGTPEHPFFVPAADRYVAMGQLRPGTALKAADGSVVTVQESQTRTGDFTVYNFEVSGTHNYYVASFNKPLHPNSHTGQSGLSRHSLAKAEPADLPTRHLFFYRLHCLTFIVGSFSLSMLCFDSASRVIMRLIRKRQ
jgi:hypothetical protein